MTKTMIGVSAAVLLLAGGYGSAEAHGGGLNSEGCHNNRKTGDYHCHRGSGSGSSAKPARAQTISKPLKSGSSSYYENCSAARADGRSNIRRGERGYGEHLDRDSDGLACER